MTMVKEVIMKTIPAGTFKAKCLAIMDDVQARNQTIIITKRGKPVAKLIPVGKTKDGFYHFLHGKGALTRDVLAPALSNKEWGELK
jgi:prevent-host-death family protein